MERRRDARRRTSGFTLIELIAVVLILGLLIALVVPGVGTLTGRRLRTTAQSMATTLELARQRTILTRIPHRVHLDLDAATWRLEWQVSDAEELGEEPLEPATPDLASEGPLDLTAPRAVERSFRPMPGRLGREEVLDEALSFAGVRTEDGFATRGETSVEFATDGSAPYTEILLDDDQGAGLVIEVLPLADIVRVFDAEG